MDKIYFQPFSISKASCNEPGSERPALRSFPVRRSDRPIIIKRRRCNISTGDIVSDKKLLYSR